MNIITKNTIKTNKKVSDTYLKIEFNNDISEDLGDVLPYPTKHYIDSRKIVYYWLISGFFGTKNSLDFVNDIKARFLITYKNQIEKTSHFPTSEKLVEPLKLRQFQNLKSKSISIINRTTRFDNSNDFVFWCLKLHCEDLIKQYGICQYETLLEFGVTNFENDVKDFSTLRCKCRNIINWYIDRDYKLSTYQRKLSDKELKMSRSKNMSKVRENIKKDNTSKIKNFLTGMFVDEYKKVNGSWNITKISQNLNVSRNTVYRVIEEENL